MPQKKKKKALGFNLQNKSFNSLKSLDLKKLKKNPLTWYAMIVFGMTLSLFTIFGSIDRFSTHRAEQYPFSTMIVNKDAGLPIALYVANITDSQAVVTLITEKAKPASLYLMKADSLDKAVSDDRGQDFESQFHIFTIKNLNSFDRYEFRICNSSNCQEGGNGTLYGVDSELVNNINPLYIAKDVFRIEGEPVVISLLPALEIAQAQPAIAYGSLSSDLKTGSDYLLRVYLPIEGKHLPNVSNQLITLSQAQEGWSLDFSNLRNNGMESFYTLTDDASLFMEVIQYDSSGVYIDSREVLWGEIKDKEFVINKQ